VQGNEKADSLAIYAASLHSVDPSQAKPILTKISNLKLIQKRLVAIIKLLPPRHLKTEASLIVKRPPSKLNTLRALLSKSDHPASIVKNRLECHGCLQSIPINAPQLPDFLVTKCCPPETQWSVAIGNRHTHPSHRQRTYGGVYICTKCGAIAREQIRNLFKLCEGPTPGGENNLKAYSRNRAPVNCPGWPYNKASFRYRHSRNKIWRQILDLDPASVPDGPAETFEEGLGEDDEDPPSPAAPASPSESSSSD